MTVSRGVEEQLISEAVICIYSDIKALSAQSDSKQSKMSENDLQLDHTTLCKS